MRSVKYTNDRGELLVTAEQIAGILYLLGQELSDKRSRLQALEESIEKTEEQIASAKHAEGLLKLVKKPQINGAVHDQI